MYHIYEHYRDECNLKDSDVAERTNITPSTFSNWKLNNIEPGAEKKKAIAECLGIDMCLLVNDYERKKKGD